MKKSVLAASAVMLATIMAPAANAAVVDGIDLSSSVSDSFGGIVGAGSFSDAFTFTLNEASALTSASITNILVELTGLGDIDFTSVDFDGNTFFNITNNFDNSMDLAYISGVPLAAGDHTLTVQGIAYGTASYGGNITISPVPEPATWAMMIAGIAAVGFAMRRRKQTTRVVFG
ncbi:MAG: PEP-CTERM sorting domain-containing protein [Sphingomonadales bacterium]|nr:MAG: PEP-CTERM sorting domain-containing protein [Sphingomonadales bacterium]